MKKLALFLLIAACLGAGGVKAEVAPKPADAEPKKVLRCEPATDSRIRPRVDAEGRCPTGSSPVRSYSREDIEQTGETDLNRALDKLDPSLSRRP